MKKITALLICFVLIFSFAGCKSDKNTAGGVDIEYYVNLGGMPESEIKLGDSVPEPDDNIYSVEAGARSFMSTGAFNYYYDLSALDKNIYAIACFSDCLGFTTGDISIEITNVLESRGINYTEREPKKDELFFLPGGENRFVIECKDLKHNLIFVFEDNALCAAYLS